VHLFVWSSWKQSELVFIKTRGLKGLKMGVDSERPWKICTFFNFTVTKIGIEAAEAVTV
jgi:hypothetical protein